ncbi:NAD/NADP transhydrogenase alpha subunit [Pseudomonas gingeri NCPPB 3146 = LMG 5327]|uniref:MSMEG_0570 family nitrogen starvation response protein n=2 Tax=Pseudomonas gingeri TaxID=117681 RepID=A0A7Y7Y4U2_9PSED|nr:MSMEG_0570 family nitrogen starvation response protein [Pseudomonas gingeri]NVZ28069.1 MSMEG_0570 family nitrogen starvation response protein [Pseudomonas gingeri]NWA06029.1 MSMEG_0570 family nitrogen starvation response protein [Pseudomonas gingeri]NWC17898.1 MSMEG_0570 family nitrogen starvation response protein [Pseudomonas gingeri]NWE50599.1 MSMEG_0570 family nitrogen starvation response protein [Pseudomonas gingeri]NWE70174.1 MSMEG_0570 family nitrogen starvation response protein [Pseu
MPAVNIRLRWPDGQESNAYSPSTTIYAHFEAGRSYAMADFMRRAETGLNAASERVRQVKGFYCSSAMDSLGGLRLMARRFPDPDARVQVLDISNQGAGKVHYAGFGDI